MTKAEGAGNGEGWKNAMSTGWLILILAVAYGAQEWVNESWRKTIVQGYHPRRRLRRAELSESQCPPEKGRRDTAWFGDWTALYERKT